jgi:hypothetical protein
MSHDWRDECRRLAPSSRADIVEPYDVCSDCQASGYKLYSDTSTWRGGIGGQMLTTAVCNKCWGSGSKSKPWPSHRQFEAMQRKLNVK